MTNERLNIVSVSNDYETKNGGKKNRREEARAKFDRIWLHNAQEFDPQRNALERERMRRIKNLLSKQSLPLSKKAVDLGCGFGILTQDLAEKGILVDAVDISFNALKRLQEKNIKGVTLIQDWVPHMRLRDEAYDIVLSTELIAYLHPDQYRLFFSELARLVKPDGTIICSTALDIYSDEALERFSSLVETEFKVEEWIFSYHSLYIRMRHFLKIPSRFARAKREPEYRQKELNKRRGFYRTWFRWNTQSLLGVFWEGIHWFTRPIFNWFDQNRCLLLLLEKVSKFLWNEKGISHVICCGKRRAITEKAEPEKEIPIERKHRKEVWE